ncbi:MAG: HAMP domain-containing protein, partial [Erythrobacter sp.]|nr:HAMP domain-containing protein [Erythrobacter sp.]
MNMMTLQERREEQAVPEFVRDLRDEFEFQDDSLGSAAPAAPVQTSLLERLAWFRNLSLANKINAIFGSFFAVGILMSLVLGLGLGQLWNRYNATARVQEALVAAGELQSEAGELRYHTVRTLYDNSSRLRESQRSSEAEVLAQIAAIDAVVGEHAPELEPRVAELQNGVSAFQREADRAADAVRGGGSVNAGAAAVALEGDRLVDAAARVVSDLADRAERQETTGIGYFFSMVLILAVLAVIGGVVLLLGIAYLSRDFARKIVEITAGMTRLAEGDRNFAIEGQERQDEIGAMIRALELFKLASRRLETWARERSDKAEQELLLQQERERER